MSSALTALTAELDSALERALSSVPRAQRPGVRRVWIDVGTWRQTLSKEDLRADPSLVVIGLEALQDNLNASTQPTTARFVRVHGACSSRPVATELTFNRHASPSCGSLLRTHDRAPQVGKKKDACVGDTPVPMAVRSVPLSLIIDRARHILHAPRIELVKIDVQGSELDCIASAATALRGVDNILLEAQDATNRSGLMLYEGAVRLPDMDAALGAGPGRVGQGVAAVTGASSAGWRSRTPFTREYCEWNTIAKTLREINCLYRNAAHPHAAWLWATGNRQLVGGRWQYADGRWQLVDGRWGSMVSYGLIPCWVRPVRLATDLHTSPTFVGTRFLPAVGDARRAQLRGESPLRNASALEGMRAAAASRAPLAVVDEQRRACETSHSGVSTA